MTNNSLGTSIAYYFEILIKSKAALHGFVAKVRAAGFRASRRSRVLLADRVEWAGAKHGELLISHAARSFNLRKSPCKNFCPSAIFLAMMRGHTDPVPPHPAASLSQLCAPSDQ
jgi:hypothetical protein